MIRKADYLLWTKGNARSVGDREILGETEGRVKVAGTCLKPQKSQVRIKERRCCAGTDS